MVLQLVNDILRQSTVSEKTLQWVVGKCVSFSLAVPAARLFMSRNMTCVVSTAARSPRHISVTGPLKDEISHWLFLESWDGTLLRRDEDHFRVSIATDSSASGLGGSILHPIKQELSDYWSPDQIALHISAKGALAIHQVLVACKDIMLTF